MARMVRCGAIILLLFVLGMAGQSFGEEPTDQLKQTIDQVIAILTDPALKDTAKAEEKRKLLRQAADQRFDWQEMARRALARHWRERTDEEKQRFTALFADLLEKTYMKRVEGYSGEKVQYDAERVEGKYAIISVRVFDSNDMEIPVDYRLKKKNAHWLIYDVYVEGVSLVNNYRTQFNTILAKAPFAELMEKLEAKISQQ